MKSLRRVVAASRETGFCGLLPAQRDVGPIRAKFTDAQWHLLQRGKPVDIAKVATSIVYVAPFWYRIYLRVRPAPSEVAMANVESNPRLSARVPRSQYDLVTEAAGLLGATVNQFVVQAAVEKAQQVMETERVIQLTNNDARVFFEALENPPAPTAALRAAAQRHTELFGRAAD